MAIEVMNKSDIGSLVCSLTLAVQKTATPITVALVKMKVGENGRSARI